MYEVYFGVNKEADKVIDDYLASMPSNRAFDISQIKCAEECSELIAANMKYLDYRVEELSDSARKTPEEHRAAILEEGVDVLFTLYKMFKILDISDIELFEMFDMKVKKFIDETIPIENDDPNLVVADDFDPDWVDFSDVEEGD